MMDTVITFVQTNWIFIGICLVVYVVAKSHGRQKAFNEMRQAQEAQAQQDAFNMYVESMKKAQGESL